VAGPIEAGAVCGCWRAGAARRACSNVVNLVAHVNWGCRSWTHEPWAMGPKTLRESSHAARQLNPRAHGFRLTLVRPQQHSLQIPGLRYRHDLRMIDPLTENPVERKPPATGRRRPRDHVH